MKYLVMLLCVIMVGCQSPRMEFVEACELATDAMIPSLVEYIRADKDLPALDRAVRIEAALEFRKMVQEESARQEE